MSSALAEQEQDDIVEQALKQIGPCPGCDETRDPLAGCVNPYCLISPVPIPQDQIPSTFDEWDVLAEARARLLDRHMHIAHAVCNMYHPLLDAKGVTTAAVGPRRGGGGIQFYFSRQFLRKIVLGAKDIDEGLDDLCAIMAHEAHHITSGHVDKMQKVANPRLYNISADVFVNTWLLHEAHLPFSSRLRKILWHAGTIGMKPHDLLWYVTAEDLYDILEQDQKKSQNLLRQFGDMFMKGDMEQLPDDSTAGGTPIDDHQMLDEITEGMSDQVLRELRDSGALDRARAAGKSPGDMERRYEDLDQDFDWEAHLRRRMASIIKRKNDYSRGHRLQHITRPSGLMKASTKILKERHILVYIDVSGSVSDEELGRFISVLRQHPKETECHVYTFDGAVNEWPDWEDFSSRPPGGGGTSFHAVVAHAEALKDFKPDVIIVLTDGGAGEPEPKRPNLWLWVTTDIVLSNKCGQWTIMAPLNGRRKRRHQPGSITRSPTNHRRAFR